MMEIFIESTQKIPSGKERPQLQYKKQPKKRNKCPKKHLKKQKKCENDGDIKYPEHISGQAEKCWPQTVQKTAKKAK